MTEYERKEKLFYCAEHNEGNGITQMETKLVF